MGMKNILVINDEAHHCYRSKPPEESEEDSLKGDEKKEAEKNKEADVRREIYSSIIEALETEIVNIKTQEGGTPTAEGKIEVIEAVISVLLKEVEGLDKQQSKKIKHPRKVKID